MEGGPAGYVDRAGCFHQIRQVERRIVSPIRIGRGDNVTRRGWSCLTASHCVNKVIDADDLKVQVAPCRMNQVISADGEQVAIPAVHHHVQLWIGQLQASSKRDRTAMSSVKR